MKYRKKPVVIEAIQFLNNEERVDEIKKFMGDSFQGVYCCMRTNRPTLNIPTLEGTMRASVGDYIIKGVNGEFYPCKPEIFEKTYEPA